MIKICGITDPETALRAARSGADFIGIVFAGSSRRFVNAALAKEISLAAKKEGAKSVGVFTNHTARQIKAMAQECYLDFVQLHGKAAKQAASALYQALPIIYGCQVEEALPEIPIEFFLYDGKIPGSGKTCDWEKISKSKSPKYFLAGGLDAGNVEDAIRLLRPAGVDVSTGVEDAVSGKKDLDKIQKFIEVVKSLQAVHI